MLFLFRILIGASVNTVFNHMSDSSGEHNGILVD